MELEVQRVSANSRVRDLLRRAEHLLSSERRRSRVQVNQPIRPDPFSSR
jgi:hypothetical protein